LPPAVGKPSELADRFASNPLMLDYFQTGAFLGASKEATLRRVLKATSFGISGLTTSRSAVGQDSITDLRRVGNSWPRRSGRFASQKLAKQLRPQIFL
jgi:hypothetical protein